MKDDTFKYRAEYIRTIGLISSRSGLMISYSLDALMVYLDKQETRQVYAIEIKTMNDFRTTEDARDVSRKFVSIILISGVGRGVDAGLVFQQLVSSTEYRLQCLHHAVCLKANKVCFVVAKGSTCSIGEIVYTAIVVFNEVLLSQYSYVLAALRVGAFEWVGKDAQNIPKEYDQMLQSSHATDLHSYATYYSLSQAYRRLVSLTGTLPPARMICPTRLVYSNHLNGGVDEFSCALTSLCIPNSSENPIVSIIGRLLCFQVDNAAIVHRLSLAKNSGALPDTWNDVKSGKGYRELRHAVTRCAFFASYARQLAKDYKALLQTEISRAQSCISRNSLPSANDQSTVIIEMKPLYQRDVVQKYNRPEDTKRKLSESLLHKRVKSKDSYCALCSYIYSIRKNGEEFWKKGGLRQKQWCSVCRQEVCTSFWDQWHKDRVLVRATIPPADLEDLRKQVP